MTKKGTFLTVSVIAVMLSIGCSDVIGMAILPSDSDNVRVDDGELGTDLSERVFIKVPITFDGGGWISGADNDLGVQGAWHYFAGVDSRIDGSFVMENAVTASGVVVPPPDGTSYGTYFGAKIGFHICASGSPTNETSEYFTAGSCTLTDGLVDKLAGISFRLEGTLPTTELRLQLHEEDRDDGTYEVVKGVGDHFILFENARIHYLEDAEPFHPDLLQAIYFYISSTGGPSSFAFIISDVAFLVNL